MIAVVLSVAPNLVMFGLMLVMFPLVMYAGQRRARRVREQAGVLASTLGLELTETTAGLERALDAQIGGSSDEAARVRAHWVQGMTSFASKLVNPWAVCGTYGGVSVTIRLVTRGSGKSRTTFTTFDAAASHPFGIGLAVTTEGMFTKLGKMFGGREDALVGVPEFDSRVLIRANDKERARALFGHSSARDATLALFEANDSALIGDGGVSCEVRGVLLDPDRCRTLVDRMTEVVRCLEEAAGQGGSGLSRATP